MWRKVRRESALIYDERRALVRVDLPGSSRNGRTGTPAPASHGLRRGTVFIFAEDPRLYSGILGILKAAASRAPSSRPSTRR
jgi:hypothetical protein